ncbi:asparagine synthase (glutamine-hydrolyzing) [Massilia sp. IC2-477]|uniref:asparagine synthase (glutamine-hydrolyzing) n=1 Tax=Massilia sp. IC2-477 TaxID=2887198 RepID=UPI001D0FBA2A|nr:asparagine synthase (glutamine-hydrolyzing) [Massilia sp. IC2-477]MCC2958538.1 asparagine synthase (glutamine-hydrolyzing) [Massilia sp. IC2-477]
MCGFTGFLGASPFQEDGASRAVLGRMTDSIRHRGPDDAGYWLDVGHGIALGHRRLAIIDLSPAGHQPMPSSSGRYVIAFNGEIYNHVTLRDELAGAGAAPAWRGRSDTETLLAGFDAWGIAATVERAVGMFAFAVWDRYSATLTLGRDRIGEKPLYYGWQGRGRDAVFVFGSELKALRAHPAFEHVVDRGALSLQLRHSYVPAPYSIYRGIAKLTPGCLLTVSSRDRAPRVNPYWSRERRMAAAAANPFSGSPQEAVTQLETLLKGAVKAQMIADVPLGAFLSGGVDSSTVVALMQAQSARPVKTFSIGFQEAGYNEAEYAKAVAQHLGTEHTELYVTAEQGRAVIPRLPSLYDEPFSDSSQMPTFLVSQLARQHVTVSLSGDAGDELFCGYSRYQFAASLWNTITAGPLPLRRLAANGITRVSVDSWNRMAKLLAPAMPRRLRFPNTGDKLHKGAQVLGCASLDALYLGLVSHWDDPAALVIGGIEPPTVLRSETPALAAFHGVPRMMALDLLTYLPDDILVKVDRAAMAVALETRIPFLDHRVVEFAWSLPQSMKLRDGASKWALRQVLYRHVPPSLIERPKMGFGVPIGDWLRGPLRDWSESLLSESRLRAEGFFHPLEIRRKWDEHLAGKRNWQYHLWDVLMFQAWAEEQSRSRPGGSGNFDNEMAEVLDSGQSPGPAGTPAA